MDGLRGLAVVAVLLYHGDKLEGGFLGVDLFFVLSGFLITQVLLRSWSNERGIALGRFWWRRVQRLLPAVLLMLIVVVPLFALRFATGPELTVLRRDGFGTLLYVANWEQIHFNQVYGASGLIAPLRHTWSLAVEEQVYLLWPLLALVLLRRGGVRLLHRGALFLAALSMGATVLIAATGWFSLNSLYLGTHSRAGAVMLGAAFATWRHGKRHPLRGAQQALDVAAVGALVAFTALIFWARVDDRWLYTGGLVVSGLCGIVLVIAASQHTPGPAVRLLEVAPLRWLGTVSYGVYLWSWPIMLMVSVRNTSLRGWTLFAVQVALTLFAAGLSWYLVERPILSNAFERRHIAVIVAIAAAVALVTIQLTTLDAKPLVSDSQSSRSYTAGGAATPKLLLLGDSVPARIADEGLEPQAENLNISVVDRSIPGCILLREVGLVRGFDGGIRKDVKPCAAGWGEDVDTLDPDAVLIMFGQFATDTVQLDGTDRAPCDSDYAVAEAALLDEAMNRVSAPGRQLFLATMPGTNVAWVLDRNPDVNEQMACLNDIYRQVAEARADTTLIDFDDFICPGGQCKTEIDGVDLREDLVHFRFRSAELVARWLVDEMQLTTLAPGGDPGGDPGVTPTTEPPAPNRPSTDPDVVRTCDELKQLTELTTTEGPGGQRILDVDGLRSLDATDLSNKIATLAPEAQPLVTAVVSNIDEIADRLQGVPDDIDPAALLERLGPLAPPILELYAWSSKNC